MTYDRKLWNKHEFIVNLLTYQLVWSILWFVSPSDEIKWTLNSISCSSIFVFACMRLQNWSRNSGTALSAKVLHSALSTSYRPCMDIKSHRLFETELSSIYLFGYMFIEHSQTVKQIKKNYIEFAMFNACARICWQIRNTHGSHQTAWILTCL